MLNQKAKGALSPQFCLKKPIKLKYNRFTNIKSSLIKYELNIDSMCIVYREMRLDENVNNIIPTYLKKGIFSFCNGLCLLRM